LAALVALRVIVVPADKVDLVARVDLVDKGALVGRKVSAVRGGKLAPLVAMDRTVRAALEVSARLPARTADVRAVVDLVEEVRPPGR
jgi:hypothetical protein